jgi:hypothetical protein
VLSLSLSTALPPHTHTHTAALQEPPYISHPSSVASRPHPLLYSAAWPHFTRRRVCVRVRARPCAISKVCPLLLPSSARALFLARCSPPPHPLCSVIRSKGARLGGGGGEACTARHAHTHTHTRNVHTPAARARAHAAATHKKLHPSPSFLYPTGRGERAGVPTQKNWRPFVHPSSHDSFLTLSSPRPPPPPAFVDRRGQFDALPPQGRVCERPGTFCRLAPFFL